MPSKKSQEASIGGIELSQVVKAAAVAIGAKDYTVSHLSLLQLAEEVGDDSLMEVFWLSVAGQIELRENGPTPRYNDLYNQKAGVEAGISDRILGPIDYSLIASTADKNPRRRLEVSRELSALSYGIFELATNLKLSKPSPSRKSKS